MKDLFSKTAQIYAQFRPKYPQYLYKTVLQHCSCKQNALDLCCGNGQITFQLASDFELVRGIDASQDQIAQAREIQHQKHVHNVEFSVADVLETGLESESFDLVTIAQALHWLDYDAAFKEVRRLLAPKGIFCVLGYKVCELIDENLQSCWKSFFESISAYWTCKRKDLDSEFSSLQFPFENVIRLSSSQFEQAETSYSQMKLDDFLSYVDTITAYKSFIEAHGVGCPHDPKKNMEIQMRQILKNKGICAENHFIDVKFPFFAIITQK